jgi:hypothetical protein
MTRIPSANSPGSREFLGVDWSSIAIVDVDAPVVTVVVVTF